MTVGSTFKNCIIIVKNSICENLDFATQYTFTSPMVKVLHVLCTICNSQNLSHKVRMLLTERMYCCLRWAGYSSTSQHSERMQYWEKNRRYKGFLTFIEYSVTLLYNNVFIRYKQLYNIKHTAINIIKWTCQIFMILIFKYFFMNVQYIIKTTKDNNNKTIEFIKMKSIKYA